MQTNPEAFRGRGVFRIVADEGMGLYRGAGWTAARNAPGSFAVSVHMSRLLLYKLVNPLPALRRVSVCKREDIQTHGLQHRLLVSKLRGIGGRCFCLLGCLRSLRCHQNQDTEPKLREP